MYFEVDGLKVLTLGIYHVYIYSAYHVYHLMAHPKVPSKIIIMDQTKLMLNIFSVFTIFFLSIGRLTIMIDPCKTVEVYEDIITVWKTGMNTCP